MKPESQEIAINLSKFKPGLIFDADGVCLFGKYHDELSAWRAKKQWINVLHDYFLLEIERDYEIGVVSEIGTLTFCLSCSFKSACGRYAFWRLINHQAPEAEKKLGGTISYPLSSIDHCDFPDEKMGNETWILSALNESAEKNTETAKILRRLLKMFQ
ncbi:MAG TPA: hypothetical protein PKA63_11880 [Oligoflexia bacterium]|nr:hypothetical protein [Oligoflexia bacterium]HMP49353.1 hypothetical protein [Oligoflexia bacterium]